jgi:hypothetical protein
MPFYSQWDASHLRPPSPLDSIGPFPLLRWPVAKFSRAPSEGPDEGRSRCEVQQNPTLRGGEEDQTLSAVVDSWRKGLDRFTFERRGCSSKLDSVTGKTASNLRGVSLCHATETSCGRGGGAWLRAVPCTEASAFSANELARTFAFTAVRLAGR